MPNLHALTFFQISNFIECGLWIAMSLVMAAVALRCRGYARQLAWRAVPVLFVFGISDSVEAFTGAWWRPWWLLIWKALCILALLILAVKYYRSRAAAVVTVSPETRDPADGADAADANRAEVPPPQA